MIYKIPLKFAFVLIFTVYIFNYRSVELWQLPLEPAAMKVKFKLILS